MRILAVDSDPVVIETLVQLILGRAGNDVIAAMTPSAALEVLDNRKIAPFDCILMDIGFAECADHGLLRAVRARPAYADVPIMILTARSGKDHIDAAFAAGATDYMTKPFEVNALMGRLTLMAAEQAAAQARKAQPAPAFDAPVALGAKLRIFDAANFIELTALENYAKQLSRGTLYGSAAYAFAIRKIDLLHQSLSPFDFHSMINDVADAIGAEMDDCQTLISYAGNGIFVGIAESNWRPQLDRVMNRVNTRLGAAGLSDGDGQDLNVKVSAGHAVRLAWKSGHSVLDALSQARGSADQARIAFEKLRREFWFMDRTA